MASSGDAMSRAFRCAIVPLPTPLSAAGTSRVLILAIAGAMTLSAGSALADEPTAGTSPAVETTPASTAPQATTSDPSAPEATTEPAPLQAGAQVPLVAASSDLLAPRVVIGEVRHQLEAARRTGLRVTFSTSEPVTVRADVLIYGDVVDRELQMSALPAAGPGDSLAKATFSQRAAGKVAVRLPFNVAARRTLRKFYKLTVRVRLIAADAAGNESTTYKRVTLTLE